MKNQHNILIIGSGGREYAIGLALSQDPRVQKLYFAPGNGATLNLGENLTYTNNNELLAHCKQKSITLVVIGPEEPLTKGVSDFLNTQGIVVFGPSAQAARLEGSKAFMKDFAMRHKIPTARYLQSDNLREITEFIHTLQTPIVIKADGLCAGKGVVISQNKDEAINIAQDMLSGKSFGNAGLRVIVEEYLDGFELSVFALSNGKDCVILNPAQDHKRLLDEDKGPNTGGMGAYTPTPMCDTKLFMQIQEDIILPAIKGMAQEGMPFVGVLFGGIMVVKKDGVLKPYLLEFNVRFGDPECEVLLPCLKTPLLDLLLAQTDMPQHIEFQDIYSVGVVVASKDYPYTNSKPQKITIRDFDKNLGHLVYAGVSKDGNDLLASGGRVLVSIGLGASLQIAQQNAYKILESVSFEGMQFRKDIAARGLAFLGH
ncbi:MAG: phosphoribosylamine--glycine ligase [Helicobacter sp.]|nr:phosphoribosylamine--glycine ligase [Helicobacter sp.]